MYSIYADNLCIYDDVSPINSVKTYKSPVLTLSDSAAGSLEITLPTTNAGYDSIDRMNTEIFVYRDGTEIWSGRVLDDSKDFYKNRKLVCEGELAYLNDSIQPQRQMLSESTTINSFFETLINEHNSQVTGNNAGIGTFTKDRTFKIGYISNADKHIYRYTNYETTLECFNKKIIEELGGHIQITKEDGYRCINYYTDDSDSKVTTTTRQEIRFGENLLDYTSEITCDDYATVIIPLGARVEDEETTDEETSTEETTSTDNIEELEEYVTVVDSKYNNGSMFVKHTNAINKFGWVCKTVKWDDVEDPDNLYDKAVEYLNEMWGTGTEISEDIELKLKFVDLHYLNSSIESVDILEQIACISEPHGHGEGNPLVLPVKELKINLAEPDKTEITLGNKIKTNLTATNNSDNSEILKKIETIPSKSNILEAAKRNALNMINDHNDGYLIDLYNDNGKRYALTIADNENPDNATSRWIWNKGGLAYQHRENGNPKWSVPNVAITMDGTIVGNFIASKSMAADRIAGGTMTVGGSDSATKDGVILIKNENDQELIKLDKSGITMSASTKISWNNIDNQPKIPTDTKDLENSAGYITSSSIPSLDGYATQQWVTDKGYVTTTYIGSNYIKTSAVIGNVIQQTGKNGSTTVGATKIENGKIYVGEIYPNTDYDDNLVRFPNGVRINGIKKYGHKGLLVQGYIDLYTKNDELRTDVQVAFKSSDTTKVIFWDNPSDVRLKHDIKELKDVKWFFTELDPKSFKFKNTDKIHYGLIAQDLREILIKHNMNTAFIDGEENDDRYLGIVYSNFHGWEIAGIKELYKEVDSLKEEISLLKQEIELLKGDK